MRRLHRSRVSAHSFRFHDQLIDQNPILETVAPEKARGKRVVPAMRAAGAPPETSQPGVKAKREKARLDLEEIDGEDGEGAEDGAGTKRRGKRPEDTGVKRSGLVSIYFIISSYRR